MRGGAERCYLCGEPGADTVDHVVPQCLYPGPMGDPLKAPAHLACNKTTTKQETTFGNLLSIAYMEEGDRNFDKAMRSLRRPEAKGLLADFVSRMRERPGGGEIGSPPGHATWVLAKITKGLVYDGSGAIVHPRDVRWVARGLSDADLTKLNPPPPQHSKNVPNVLDAFWCCTPKLPVHAYLRFYGRGIYRVTAIRSTEVLKVRDWGAVMLRWPRS